MPKSFNFWKFFIGSHTWILHLKTAEIWAELHFPSEPWRHWHPCLLASSIAWGKSDNIHTSLLWCYLLFCFLIMFFPVYGNFTMRLDMGLSFICWVFNGPCQSGDLSLSNKKIISVFPFYMLSLYGTPVTWMLEWLYWFLHFLSYFPCLCPFVLLSGRILGILSNSSIEFNFKHFIYHIFKIFNLFCSFLIASSCFTEAYI